MSDVWLPMSDTETGGLQGRVARGLRWTIIDIWGRQVLNLVVFVVLARLLLPADFGLVALAAVFVTFAQMIVDQGLGDALIQRREITRLHIDTAFWAAVATGASLTVGGFLLSAPIAAFLRQPELEPILRVLSLTFLLAAFTSIQIALLRRELAFRSLAVRTLAATLVGGLVGIVLAILGAGPWALVGQQVAAAAISVVALWRVSPWRPSFEFSGELFRQLFPFGVRVVGSDVLTFLSRQSDNFLVGVVLGTVPLGIYAVGYRLLDVSQTLLLNVVRKITFPAFSRLQHDHERMRRAYFRVTRVAALVILPGYIGLAILSPRLTIVVFGQRWAESGVVASILMLIGPVLSLQAFGDTLLNAWGHPEIVLRFRFITTVTNVAGFLIAVPFGILAVALAFVIRGYLLLPVILRWMHVYTGISIRAYLSQFRGIGLATVVMAAAMLATGALLKGAVPEWVVLVGQIGIGGLTLLAVLLAVERPLLGETFGVVADALPVANRLRRRG